MHIYNSFDQMTAGTGQNVQSTMNAFIEVPESLAQELGDVHVNMVKLAGRAIEFAEHGMTRQKMGDFAEDMMAVADRLNRTIDKAFA